MEVSPSGRWQRIANPRPQKGLVGSNPTTSAQTDNLAPLALAGRLDGDGGGALVLSIVDITLVTTL